ncbi:MAG TPA: hypothetical protein VJU82_14665 [Acidobacteriaceae bacterium]|nr:hypothetical protein [Acidobacteriaceae bacterium]
MIIFSRVVVKAEWAFRMAAVAFMSGIILVVTPDIPSRGLPTVNLVTLAAIGLGLVLFLLTGYVPGWRALGSALIAPEVYLAELPPAEMPDDVDIASVARDAEAAAEMRRQRDGEQRGRGCQQ